MSVPKLTNADVSIVLTVPGKAPQVLEGYSTDTEFNSAPSAADRLSTPSSNEGGLSATVGAVPKVYVLTCDYSQDTRTIAGVYAHQGMAEATQKMHEATRQCWADDHTIEEHEIVE